MTAMRFGDMIETRKYAVPLYLSLIAAGLAGNYFKFSILNADFIFGSIFAMLALQFFGLGPGIPAAAIIAGYTYLAWNHPYAIITMTAEAAVVGCLITRQKISLLMADTLYWLVIGIPLGFVCFYFIADLPASNGIFLMTKQAINGIANALVARLIFAGFTFRSRSSLISYREILSTLLAFFVLTTTLIILVVGGRTDFAETDRHIRAMLTQDSRRIADRVETWVMNRKSAILNLAEMAASRSPQQMQPYLEQAKKSDLNFLRIGLLDREATTKAHFPLLDELGQSNIGRSFADRPFIPILKQTLKPMLSEVVMSRFGIPQPMVAVLAPVVIRGEYGGYVIGFLGMEQIRTHLIRSTDENSALYTLLDKNGTVIMTNRTDQTVMAPFVRGQGTINRLDNTIGQWVPTLPSNTSTIALWGKSFYVAETAIGDLAEWKLILEQPVAPFQKKLYDQYTGKMILLFVILLGTLALAEFLSRKVVVTLEQLRTLTHDLPVRLSMDGREIAWPESGVTEAKHLIDNFREMANSLAEKFIEIRKINESLEQRVEERTGQLTNITHELGIILENAPVGISRIIDRKQVWVNRKIEEMFQYSKEELEYQTTRKLYPSDEAYEQLGQEAYPVLAQGRVFETVQELIRKDGVHIQVRYIGKAIEPQDMSRGTLWLLEDITERRRMEDALRESEERYRQLVEYAPAAIYEADLTTGRLLSVNEVLCEYSGYTRDELLALNPLDLMTEESRKLILQRIAGYAAGEPVSPTVEYKARSKTGREFWISTNAKYFYQEGRPVRATVVAHDITDRKQIEEALTKSEEKFRKAFYTSPDAVNINRLEDGMYVSINPGFTKITGYTEEEIIGKTSIEYSIWENIEDRQRLVAGLRKSGEVANLEAAFRMKGGDLRFGLMSASVITLDGVPHILSITRDITDRKRVEEEREKLQAQLLQAQKMESVGRLAGGVAHDFNNMLGVILGHAEIAIEQAAPPQPLYASLLEIKKATERSSDLTRQLLAFARQQPVAPKVLDLNETIANMLKMLQRLIGENIDLKCHLEANLWSVKVDPSQIDQLLANLCINARDAMSDAGKITIETGNLHLDEAYCRDHAGFVSGEYVSLIVSDDGCGMDKETIGKIFEPFFTTKEAGKGTGLGLATVYGIVKQNKGFINVYSEPRQGTAFTIYLPRHLGASEQAPAARPREPLMRGQETVLLVEDEPALLELNKIVLEAQGYRVLTAGAPSEAIRLARENAGAIHLLMTDVVMPEMNGRDLAQNLSALNPHLKCLFTSGYTANVIAHHGVLDEGVSFIQKPFSRKDLAAKVREVLDRK